MALGWAQSCAAWLCRAGSAHSAAHRARAQQREHGYARQCDCHQSKPLRVVPLNNLHGCKVPSRDGGGRRGRCWRQSLLSGRGSGGLRGWGRCWRCRLFHSRGSGGLGAQSCRLGRRRASMDRVQRAGQAVDHHAHLGRHHLRLVLTRHTAGWRMGQRVYTHHRASQLLASRQRRRQRGTRPSSAAGFQ